MFLAEILKFINNEGIALEMFSLVKFEVKCHAVFNLG